MFHVNQLVYADPIKLNTNHKSYPKDLWQYPLKVVDWYHINADLYRLTVSCEQKPNTRSKKGVYYFTSREVNCISGSIENSKIVDSKSLYNFNKVYCCVFITKILSSLFKSSSCTYEQLHNDLKIPKKVLRDILLELELRGCINQIFSGTKIDRIELSSNFRSYLTIKAINK